MLALTAKGAINLIFGIVMLQVAQSFAVMLVNGSSAGGQDGNDHIYGISGGVSCRSYGLVQQQF